MSEATSEGNPRSAAPGAQQHTVALSAALHLLPGVLIAAFYFLVGVPIAEGLDYPSLFGLLLSVVFVLLPSELGWFSISGRGGTAGPRSRASCSTGSGCPSGGSSCSVSRSWYGQCS
jgi:hypothetical protein